MQSLEILKQELITQKKLLEEKGFPVDVKNTNPSPSEITKAIGGINFDLTDATAEESDVKQGKTFYSKIKELKTGTFVEPDFSVVTATPEDVVSGKKFYTQDGVLNTGLFDVSEIDELKARLYAHITGLGSFEIDIPTDESYANIRHYAFAIYNNNTRLFYKENLTIPPNIKQIGDRAFYKAYLTGKLTIPPECTFVGAYAFQHCPITEALVGGGIAVNSSYVFGSCLNLKKVVLAEGNTVFSNYMFTGCTSLEEIEIPSTQQTVASTGLYNCNALKIIKFIGTKPPTVYAGTFSYSKRASIIVPYLNFNAYYTSSNYLINGQKMYGYGNFNTGDVLPTVDADGLYSITWYTSIDDAKELTNPVTVSPSTNTLYAVFVEKTE